MIALTSKCYNAGDGGKNIKISCKSVQRGLNTLTWKCYDAMTFNKKNKVNKKMILE